MDDLALAQGIEGPWHEVIVYVDTTIGADGAERPTWAFEGPHCDETCADPGECLLLTMYWPPEHDEVPAPGRYLVRYSEQPDRSMPCCIMLGDLEWQER